MIETLITMDFVLVLYPDYIVKMYGMNEPLLDFAISENNKLWDHDLPPRRHPDPGEGPVLNGRSRYPPLDPNILEPMKSKSLFVIKEMMQYKFVDELKTVSGLNSCSVCNAQCDPFSSMIASIVNPPHRIKAGMFVEIQTLFHWLLRLRQRKSNWNAKGNDVIWGAKKWI